MTLLDETVALLRAWAGPAPALATQSCACTQPLGPPCYPCQARALLARLESAHANDLSCMEQAQGLARRLVEAERLIASQRAAYEFADRTTTLQRERIDRMRAERDDARAKFGRASAIAILATDLERTLAHVDRNHGFLRPARVRELLAEIGCNTARDALEQACVHVEELCRTDSLADVAVDVTGMLEAVALDIAESLCAAIREAQA